MMFTGKKLVKICTSSLFLQPPSDGWRLGPSTGSSRNGSNGNDQSSRFSGTAGSGHTRSWLRSGGNHVVAIHCRGHCCSTPMSMSPVIGSANLADKTKRIRALLRRHHDHPADGLQVIMDFDLTMTAPGSEQCHHMFETSSALPQELRSRLRPFFTGELKLTTRDAWWNGFHGVLIEEGITKAQVAAVAAGADLTLRAGTAELLLLLQEQGVPLLVVSAGITDIVVETLREHGLLLDNITVRANTMAFGSDGKLERFRESSPVHSRNKDQTAQRERNYFASNGHRRCVVVVGDKPADADVTIGFASDERCLKIGFFDHSHEHPHPDLPPLPPRPPEKATEGSGGGTYKVDGGDTLLSEVLEFSSKSSMGTSSSDEWKLSDRTGTGTSVATARAVATDVRNSGDFPVGAASTGGGAADKSSRLVGEVSPPYRDDSTQPAALTGRPGSQGGGEVFVSRSSENDGRGTGDDRHTKTTVGVEDMLLAYGDTFDVVACGGHSMDLVADFVRHFVGVSSPGDTSTPTGVNSESGGSEEGEKD